MKKYKINKSYQDINKKIKTGEVVVVTAGYSLIHFPC